MRIKSGQPTKFTSDKRARGEGGGGRGGLCTLQDIFTYRLQNETREENKIILDSCCACTRLRHTFSSLPSHTFQEVAIDSWAGEEHTRTAQYFG